MNDILRRQKVDIFFKNEGIMKQTVPIFYTLFNMLSLALLVMANLVDVSHVYDMSVFDFEIGLHNPTPYTLQICFCHLWANFRTREILITNRNTHAKLTVHVQAPIRQTGEVLLMFATWDSNSSSSSNSNT